MYGVTHTTNRSVKVELRAVSFGAAAGGLKSGCAIYVASLGDFCIRRLNGACSLSLSSLEVTLSRSVGAPVAINLVFADQVSDCNEGT